MYTLILSAGCKIQIFIYILKCNCKHLYVITLKKLLQINKKSIGKNLVVGEVTNEQNCFNSLHLQFNHITYLILKCK